MVAHNIKSGDAAEQRAYRFLLAKGLKFLIKNYRCKQGEIDLIMRDNQDIVFIEVRSRTDSSFGSAIESINKNKQRKILCTAIHFLQERNWLDKENCRFDVIGISQDNIEWIKNAFNADIL